MRPFEGLRVLDLTHVFAGPFCTYQLAVLGAEVIKIEPVDRPDMTRFEGADPVLNAAGMGLSFQAQGAGKSTLALDLKSDEGQALFEGLVARSDVVVQNYTYAAVQDLRLDYPRLAALRPDLIYCAISGFGQSGPKQAHPAYDTVIQAFSGIMAANGEADRDPVRVGPAMVDYGTGAQAALAIAAALYGRARTGQGRYIDVAMADCALMLQVSGTVQALATGTGPSPHGSADPRVAGYACYDTADGRLMVGAYTNRQNADLMRVLGNEAAAVEIEHTPRETIADTRSRFSAFLEATFRTRSARHWEDLLNRHHVPAARVRRVEEALQEDQIGSRQVIQKAEGQPVAVAGFSYDQGSPAADHAPRPHGADSARILAELGVDEARFAELCHRGVTR